MTDSSVVRVITGNQDQFDSWRRRHKHIKNPKRVSTRLQVNGIRNVDLYLSCGYTWNEPLEVAAICEIVTLNGGRIIHSHQD